MNYFSLRQQVAAEAQKLLHPSGVTEHLSKVGTDVRDKLQLTDAKLLDGPVGKVRDRLLRSGNKMVGAFKKGVGKL